jgi:hypothetical protein
MKNWLGWHQSIHVVFLEISDEGEGSQNLGTSLESLSSVTKTNPNVHHEKHLQQSGAETRDCMREWPLDHQFLGLEDILGPVGLKMMRDTQHRQVPDEEL